MKILNMKTKNKSKKNNSKKKKSNKNKKSMKWIWTKCKIKSKLKLMMKWNKFWKKENLNLNKWLKRKNKFSMLEKNNITRNLISLTSMSNKPWSSLQVGSDISQKLIWTWNKFMIMVITFSRKQMKSKFKSSQLKGNYYWGRCWPLFLNSQAQMWISVNLTHFYWLSWKLGFMYKNWDKLSSKFRIPFCQ